MAPAPPPPTERATTATVAVPAERKSSGNGVWIFISILLLLLLVGAGAIAAYFARDYFHRPIAVPVEPTPAAATAGRVIVNSVPTSARVWLDGQEIGTTPLIKDTVASGDHQIRLERSEYEPLALNVEVVSGQTANVGVLHLVPLPKAPEPAPVPVVPNQPANIPTKRVEEIGLTDAAAENVMVRLLEATEQRDVNGIIACYATPVDYFDEGVMTQAKLAKSLRTYVQMWPAFDIQLLSAHASPTNDPDEKVVSAKYRFVARNGSKTASGIATDTMTVRRYSDGVFVRHIRQTVTDRQKNF